MLNEEWDGYLGSDLVIYTCLFFLLLFFFLLANVTQNCNMQVWGSHSICLILSIPDPPLNSIGFTLDFIFHARKLDIANAILI